MKCKSTYRHYLSITRSLCEKTHNIFYPRTWLCVSERRRFRIKYV